MTEYVSVLHLVVPFFELSTEYLQIWSCLPSMPFSLWLLTKYDQKKSKKISCLNTAPISHYYGFAIFACRVRFGFRLSASVLFVVVKTFSSITGTNTHWSKPSKRPWERASYAFPLRAWSDLFGSVSVSEPQGERTSRSSSPEGHAPESPVGHAPAQKDHRAQDGNKNEDSENRNRTRHKNGETHNNRKSGRYLANQLFWGGWVWAEYCH